MAFNLLDRENHVPAEVPKPALVTCILLVISSFAVLAVCLTRRVQTTGDWRSIPLTRWLLFAIYIDSMLFIIITGLLEHAFGLNSTQTICSAAILMCLICYMTTKLIYYFLVEKVYIIRRVQTPRLKSKLYCFNCFAMLLPYCGVVVLNFLYRKAYFDKTGTCIIGMQAKAMMPLIIFDALVNLYLTMLFVLPLRSLYSYRNSPNSIVRTIAFRSFVGSLGTLTSSVINLTVLMALKGEAAWLCLMCCNADILFSVLVLHWVTSKDKSYISSTARSSSLAGLRSPQSTPNKLEQFEFGTASGSGKNTGITTHISAVGTGTDDEEIQRVHWEHAQTDNWGSFPIDSIKVEVGQVVQVETEEGFVVEVEAEGRVVVEVKTEGGFANASVRGSQTSTMNGEEMSRASHMSTKDPV